MVVKVYISGISGSKEVKKRQQRVILILESKNIKYELLDIAEPNMEEAKEYMQNNSKEMGCTISDPNPRHPLPPQLFNGDEYCGDYDGFDMANEIDEMGKFLKLAPDELPPSIFSETETKMGNGEIASETKSKEGSQEKEESKVKENGNVEESTAAENETETSEETPKEKSPSPEKEKSPAPEKEKSATPEKEKSPSVEKEKSPTPEKEKSPSVDKEKSPSVDKEKSPSVDKEKSPTPEKEKSPSPAKEDNATDDQKAEDGSKAKADAKESEEEEGEEE